MTDLYMVPIGRPVRRRALHPAGPEQELLGVALPRHPHPARYGGHLLHRRRVVGRRVDRLRADHPHGGRGLHPHGPL